ERAAKPRARGALSATTGAIAGIFGGDVALNWVALHAAFVPGVPPALWVGVGLFIAVPLAVGASRLGLSRTNAVLEEWVPRQPPARRRPLIPNALFKEALRPRDEKVPQEVVAQHLELLRTLTPEERAKLDSAWRRAVTHLRRHWLRRGVRLRVTHAPWLVRSVSGDAKARARTMRTLDGLSYVLLARDEVSASSEEALVFKLLHELHYAELERVVFEEVDGEVRDVQFGVWAFSLEHGKVLETHFSKQLQRFAEAQTEFRTALLAGGFVDGGYTDGALAFLSFYKMLPRAQRDDFVRSLEAASLLNSFEPVAGFFVTAGAPSQTSAQLKKLFGDIVNTRFDALRKAMSR
ncbi:MAG: hypothetical protein ACKVPX_13890, partial [Myxococcaceae bacterium]